MRSNPEPLACLLALLAAFATMPPALAEEIDLPFELPVSEMLTYQLSTTLTPPVSPRSAGPAPMLELSAILNIEIEPEDTDGLHPFTYWLDSFELTLFGLPFHHLLGRKGGRHVHATGRTVRRGKAAHS